MSPSASPVFPPRDQPEICSAQPEASSAQPEPGSALSETSSAQPEPGSALSEASSALPEPCTRTSVPSRPSTTSSSFNDLDSGKILNLLKGAMKSKTPLTDVLLRDSVCFNCEDNNTQGFNPIETPRVKVKSGKEANGSKRICVRLLESKSKDKVVYVESGEDLVDQLFSFLTFPLGSIVKFLNKQSSF